MESGLNIWVWLMGVVSRRRVWLVGGGYLEGTSIKLLYIE